MFATLDVAVAPLRLGFGVKIKVFETIDIVYRLWSHQLEANGSKIMPVCFALQLSKSLLMLL